MRVLMLILLCLTLTACRLPGGIAVWNGSSASTGASDLVLDAGAGGQAQVLRRNGGQHAVLCHRSRRSSGHPSCGNSWCGECGGAQVNAEYHITIADRISKYCPSCDRPQYIYVQVVDGVRLTCCTKCSRIIERGK